MKIRNLLLGSIATAGLAVGGAQAADLGVLTSLDVCDTLGLTGLTISSDASCVQISGSVGYSYSFGNYEGPADAKKKSDSASKLESKLTVTATSDSSFGKAKGVITLKDVQQKTITDAAAPVNGGDNAPLNVDEAYVSIGDSTVIMAGKKGSIYNDGADAPLTWLDLFKSEAVDTGVSVGSTKTGGKVLQVTTDLGSGIALGAGFEDLEGKGTTVGVLSYSSDTMSGHVSFAKGGFGSDTDSDDDWKLHAAFSATFDNYKFVFADAIAKDKYNALFSASATFDMFTLAAGLETADDYQGAGVSAKFAVSEGVTLNIGSRWSDTADVKKSEIAAGLSTAITETVTLSGKVGSTHADGVDKDVTYGKATLDWAPGGGFTGSVNATVWSDDKMKVTAELKKSF